MATPVWKQRLREEELNGFCLRLQGPHHRARGRRALGRGLGVGGAAADPAWRRGAVLRRRLGRVPEPQAPAHAGHPGHLRLPRRRDHRAGEPHAGRRSPRVGAADLDAALGLPLSRGLRRLDRAHLLGDGGAGLRTRRRRGPARHLRVRALRRRARRRVPGLPGAERLRAPEPARSPCRASSPTCS